MINQTNLERNLLKTINVEIASLSSTLSIQKNLNKQILIFVKKCVGSIDVDFDSFMEDNNLSTAINGSISHLNKSTENIKSIEKLLKLLENIKFSIVNSTKEEIEKKLDDFNNQYADIINKIFLNTSDIEKFIHQMTLANMTELSCKDETEDNKEEIKEFTDFAENTLVISDTKKKVVLPYKLSDLKNTLLQYSETYSSLQDVIDKNYTIPMDNYKFASIARFKEAFKLMIEKEHSSRLKALSLAVELFSNYNLHPAVITACKSLDELDIYLSCLEFNELDDFHFFNIKYEIPLVASSKFKLRNIVAK